MNYWSKTLFILLSVALFLAACSPKIYRPPALGAEYQFDRGLPPEKHTNKLFDKKMQAYLQEQGIQKKEHKTKTVTTASPAKDTTKQDALLADSSRQEAAPTTLSPEKTVSPDSSHTGPY